MAECNQCRRPLPADAVGGACPACLLGLARPSGRDPAEQVTEDQQSRMAGSFPDAAELDGLFPQYRVDSLIGQGGMGAVYKAHQPGLDRAVALKIMAPRFAGDPSFAERFAREARTMARLNHQNIVNVYDYGQNGSLCWLVMEYVEGVNLRQAMREGQLTAEQALAVVPQVCEALQFAHDEGIVHRDIKPENILIDRKGRVKIADFGLAKLVSGESDPPWTLTGSRQVLGTVNYMSPEQIERPASVDHRADIYSLGVVLYELLTGELPLGRFQLPGEKFAGHAALDSVVLRTLEKSPERRFQQASEFRTAVEAARNSSGFRPLGPPRNGPAQPGPVPAPPSSPAPAPAPAPFPVPAASDPRNPRVSFTVEDGWGITKTHGVLKVTRDSLLIDYSRRDNIFNSTLLGSKGVHQIEWNAILKADLKEGWYSHSIVLGMDSPQGLAGLPTESPGTQTLEIEGEQLQEARAVVNAIRAAIGQPPLVFKLEKPDVLRANAKRRVGWPATGLILTGGLNLVVLPLLLILWTGTDLVRGSNDPAGAEGSRTNPPAVSAPVDADKTPAIVINGSPRATSVQAPPNSGPVPANGGWSAGIRNASGGLLVLNIGIGVLWMVLGTLIASAGISMLTLKKRGWSIAMSIVALVPIHPGCLLGIPAGIWSLVELSRPSNRVQFDAP